MAEPPAAVNTMQVTDSADGAVVPIRATPRAGKSAFAGVRDGVLLVRLRAAPADGAANAELIALLADVLGVPKRDVALISGQSSRTKRVRVSGLSAAVATARLSAALDTK